MTLHIIQVNQYSSKSILFFKYCFRRFRVLGLQFTNLFLCSRTLRYFCDLLSCCSALEPKTLRLCDCYVADLQHDALMRLMNLCSKYLIVLSFII
ncbi:unnamed protein product [Onchocerca flexuosa]|uniref:Ovule protein n=1 Tax=Onchocerca flexuosa TaxID=387005 RepID=A0A183I7L3_9BILA|nr:unnamed protein product [Onchocerca flexuosa]